LCWALYIKFEREIKREEKVEKESVRDR